MRQTTGGGAIVDQLVREGVETVFGLPGVQLYSLFDAFDAARDQIRVINPRHEQGCSHMAFGAARSTGRPSVYAVVPGPGVLNSGAGLLNAFGCNAPVLCLTGQVPSTFLGLGRGHLHEMPDQLATLRGLTKWAARIDDGAAAPDAVAQAFRWMRSGRPGPAALEMPWDVMDAPAGSETVDPLPVEVHPEIDQDALAAAADLVARARNPMIFVGGGAIEARESIAELARRLGAPVVAFRSGRGIVSDDDPLGVSIVAARTLWPKVDVLIAIGTRLELPDWRWSWQPAGVQSIRIDIDPKEFVRRPSTVDILADASEGVSGLLAELEGRALVAGHRDSEIEEAKQEADRRIRVIQPQLDYLDIVREVLPRDAIICDELTQVGFASWFGLPIYEPRTFITSGYQGTLGSGFLTALGAKAVNPDRAVVSLTGDGGFLFGMQDLATAADFQLGVVTIVFNNGVYGNVMRDQDLRFGGRHIATELGTPDLVMLARSFGVDSIRVASPAELRPALATAIESTRPWLIDVTIPAGTEANPWPFIHPAPGGSGEELSR